jgi:hypothetical protein
LEGEWEGEYEGEWEGEWEGEYEGEEFFRRLGQLAQRARQSPTLRNIARRARNAALGMRMAGLALHPLAEPALPVEPPPHVTMQEPRRRGRMVQHPDEEFEWELEGELSPLRRVYPDALMEHLGHAAAQAESEAEAEAFLGALIPLAAQLAPRIAPAIMRAAPGLIRGVAGVARTLRRSPATRPLVRTVPTIVRRTAANIAQQAAQGQSMTPQRAVQTLARQTAQVLSSPQQSVQAYQRSCALDRRFHNTAGGTNPALVRALRARAARGHVPGVVRAFRARVG